jgi:hypothetical protein
MLSTSPSTSSSKPSSININKNKKPPKLQTTNLYEELRKNGLPEHSLRFK